LAIGSNGRAFTFPELSLPATAAFGAAEQSANKASTMNVTIYHNPPYGAQDAGDDPDQSAGHRDA
jgi:hypothetical protein